MDPMGIAVDRYEFSSCAKKNNRVPGLWSANPMKFCTLIANPVEKRSASCCCWSFLLAETCFHKRIEMVSIPPGSMLLDHWWRITMKMLSRNDHPALRTTTPRWTGGWKTESFAVTPGIISLGDFLPLSSCEKRKSQVKKMFPSQWNLLINLSLRKRMVKLPKVPLISSHIFPMFSPPFLPIFSEFSKQNSNCFHHRSMDLCKNTEEKSPQVK